jgi:hypothetical protein
MNEAALKQKLDELADALVFPPTEPGKVSSEDICIHGKAKDQDNIEELLDHLRLQIKFLMFDLEATRRENSYLRRMLETRHKNNDEDTGPPKW